jgi:bifunctional polynucleotide phosphatase/kinase
VPEIIKKLHSSGYSIYVFTNQTKEWKIDMIKESLGTIGIPIKVVIGFGKGAQKPNKKLFFDNVSVKFSKKSFYTGDAWDSSIHFSDSDLEFAKNVGINFKIPEEIFPIELVKKQDSKKYEKSHQEIVILTGFPASGKSTFIKNKLKTYEVVSGDVLKTLPKMLNTATKYLDLGKSVVFDATNPKKENRDKIIQLGKKYKIPVRCFVFNVDIETALEWNTKRFNETGKKVPKIAFYVHRKNYIRPTEEDGCLIVDID